LPRFDPIPIEQNEEGLEEVFFFAIASFLEDIFEVRVYVAREWDEYIQTGEGLTRTALLSNTGVDLVRSAEHQFEQMLIRPTRFPASAYPVWTLPALLSYHSHAQPGEFETLDKSSLDFAIKPSSTARTCYHASIVVNNQANPS
jgi:hypothetical protein